MRTAGLLRVQVHGDQDASSRYVSPIDTVFPNGPVPCRVPERISDDDTVYVGHMAVDA